MNSTEWVPDPHDSEISWRLEARPLAAPSMVWRKAHRASRSWAVTWYRAWDRAAPEPTAERLALWVSLKLEAE